ncbi:hypothetical protein ACL2XG_20595 [Sodalis sp. RH24]|uniref:hypothetical protein n=1 Tax=unclassified Sodalis (in: enterobacteria) TaxID=2636512 RepID=UPI0039B67C7B
MMRFEQVSLTLLIFLIVYWSLIIFTAIFFVSLAVAAYFFIISDIPFYFDWLSQFISAAKKGISVGLVLSIGIWIEAKLRNSKCTKSDE